jgi:hypothetical protein
VGSLRTPGDVFEAILVVEKANLLLVIFGRIDFGGLGEESGRHAR